MRFGSSREQNDRIETMLPPMYQQRYKDVLPVSMGSAALKYGSDGMVLWGQMWASFCDLAMAGGPPHRGSLLEPGTPEAIAASSADYDAVVAEICRGIGLVTGMRAMAAGGPGWIAVTCADAVMAAWLARAIVMENVSARAEGKSLLLPAGPGFRVQKEIKNVITSVAKTAHFWSEHMPLPQQEKIGRLIRELDMAAPLLAPDWMGNDAAPGGMDYAALVGELILSRTGLRSSPRRCGRWLGLGVEEASVAVAMMRFLVVSNVLSRREGTVLFVPLRPVLDPEGERTAGAVSSAYRMAAGAAEDDVAGSMISSS